MDMVNNKELELLKFEIEKGKNKDKFKTFSIETSGGKTTTAIEVFKKSNKKNSYVFVTKLTKEAVEIATEINKDLDEKIAIALISDKNIENENCTRNVYDIVDKNIVIITHSMYQRITDVNLSKKQKTLRDIIKKFRTLIIDEEINPVKNSFYAFDETISSLYNLLNSYDSVLGNALNCIIKPLLEQLHSEVYIVKNQICRVKEFEYDYEEILKNIKIVRESIGEINEEYLEDKFLEENPIAKKETIYDLVNKVAQTWDCVYEGLALIHPAHRTIYSYDYSYEYLMLKNNIWLDASACFNTMYKNDLFDLVETERVIDHSECKVEFMEINTTSSTKNKDSKFREDISNFIKEKSTSPSLVLTKKVETKQLEEKYLNEVENVSFLNFENMRGVNDFKDYKQCFYIHTYRLPVAYYVFLNDYFNNEMATDFDMKTGNRLLSWGFKNSETLNRLMITDMASSMYQGLKRVERNRKPQATYYIATKEYEVTHLALSQMKNLPVKDMKKVERKMTDEEKLIKWIDEEWDKKRLVKEDARKEVGITDSSWRKIWKKESFLSKMKERRVKLGLTKHSKKTLYLMKY